MKNLNAEDKLDIIRQYAAEHQIKPITIAKATGLAFYTCYQVLTCDEWKPQDRTLNTIIDYLEERLTGKKPRKADPEQCDRLIETLRMTIDAKETIIKHQDHIIRMQEEKLRMLGGK